MQIGIVGLPYSGKSTLFQTLTQIHLDAAALQKREANQAIVKVPDARLDALDVIFKPKKSITATIDMVDMVGLQKGDRASASFSSQFLTKVKTNDALIHVVRGFKDEAVPHVDGSVDILRDIKTLEEEFIFTDLEFLEKRFEKLEKDLKKPKAKDDALKEIEAMKKWQAALEEEIPLRDLEMTEDELGYVKNYQPLTAKPMLIALNLDEDDVAESAAIVSKVKESIKGKAILVEPLFAKIEMELAQLDDEEKAVFMEEYGLTDSPLDRMIRGAYDLLGLHSFFTVGEDENRAWTIKKASTAQEAAGAIHTDFYNKFIRAEVTSYKDFIENGTFAKCKEKGVFRLEGKEYVVIDGDILNIRHG